MHKEYSGCKLLLILIFAASMAAGCATGSHMGIVFCSTCHEGTPTVEKPSLKYSGDPSMVCQDCHKYKDDADHHPTSIISGPFGNTAVLDPSFKLFDKKMECLTCHHIHVEGYKRSSKNFLVGGPYEDRREPCFRCHRHEIYNDINPHDTMLDKDKKLEHGTCLICHSEPPDPATDTFQTVKFRASIAFLCWRCHPPMAGNFLDKHFLRRPSRSAMVEIRRSGNFVPMDHKGRITCSSCHNPHQRGVMKNTFVAAGAGEEKRLRYQDICVSCHSGKRSR